ncbi:MurR/RpiR family transcriptional regulator [Vagococcus elongatus]|uniref:RpiR family transcriptional regulator n=1 Tax=Vagococcus elongatus TaxID=180344 RepID=A0A430B4F8_9ENTE|nr:MurR/RpiR family transcriptional regulator [Vagococcus elongatus]RSU15092.1 RpiR family transcriptional regulator [Vagococcus elongatus]
MNIINFLTQHTSFTSSEQVIKEYILSDTETVLHMSIYELANRTHSSTSTIVRLCKKCGVKGYQEFKIVLARDFEDHLRRVAEIDVHMPFDPKDTDLMISSKIAQLTNETVSETQSLLKTRTLNHCVDLIVSAQKITAIGVSDCFLRLKDFQLKLLRINKYVRLIDFQAEQFFLANSSTPNDIAVLVSYSGKTAEIVNDARHFHKNGTPIIAITSDRNSPLASYATEVLLLPNKEQSSVKVSNFSSQIAIEYVLNVLYSCVFNRNFDNNYKNQKYTPISKFEF